MLAFASGIATVVTPATLVAVIGRAATTLPELSVPGAQAVPFHFNTCPELGVPLNGKSFN